MKDEVINILKIHQFVEYKPTLKNANTQSEKLLLDFDEVYSNGKEIYIVLENLEESFSDEQIRAYEDKVNSFLYTLSNNDGIKYNINLIMICPLNENINILNFERDKYICRKTFLNSQAENFMDEIKLLPFIPISSIIEDFETDLSREMEFLEEITGNNKKILDELLTINPPNIFNIEQELTGLVLDEGVEQDEQ